MKEEKPKEEEQDTRYTFDIVFSYLVKKKDFVSSQQIMDECKLGKTQYYNTLTQLKKMRLIEVKIDMADFRKKYYKAKQRRDKVL